MGAVHNDIDDKSPTDVQHVESKPNSAKLSGNKVMFIREIFLHMCLWGHKHYTLLFKFETLENVDLPMA